MASLKINKRPKDAVDEKAKQIDAALGRYYVLKGRDDYFEDDGMGLFYNYCCENGLSLLLSLSFAYTSSSASLARQYVRKIAKERK